MTPRPDQAQRDALMARRKKKPKSRRQELLEELIAEAGPEALKDPEGLLKELTRSLVNTAMDAELSHHLVTAEEDPSSCARMTDSSLSALSGGQIAISLPSLATYKGSSPNSSQAAPTSPRTGMASSSSLMPTRD